MALGIFLKLKAWDPKSKNSMIAFPHKILGVIPAEKNLSAKEHLAVEKLMQKHDF